MKKINTAVAGKIETAEGQKLTVGQDLGDRSSWYCVLNEAGEVLVERKLATTHRVSNMSPARCLEHPPPLQLS